MREIRTSGLMSGEGKRGHWLSLNATAPFLDSTGHGIEASPARRCRRTAARRMRLARRHARFPGCAGICCAPRAAPGFLSSEFGLIPATAANASATRRPSKSRSSPGRRTSAASSSRSAAGSWNGRSPGSDVTGGSPEIMSDWPRRRSPSSFSPPPGQS